MLQNNIFAFHLKDIVSGTVCSGFVDGNSVQRSRATRTISSPPAVTASIPIRPIKAMRSPAAVTRGQILGPGEVGTVTTSGWYASSCAWATCFRAVVTSNCSMVAYNMRASKGLLRHVNRSSTTAIEVCAAMVDGVDVRSKTGSSHVNTTTGSEEKYGCACDAASNDQSLAMPLSISSMSKSGCCSIFVGSAAKEDASITCIP